MKKWILLCCVFMLAAAFIPAKEYSYLDPPTISVMDFEVDIEEPLYDGNPVSKEYYGQLINHTLVTTLIQKNNEFGLIIPRHPYFPAINNADANEEKQGARKVDAEYFPPLLKIYDKKYVESALAENNYTLNDLYTKAPGAFNFPDLDFMVLGNVFEFKDDRIAINVRVLNTYRGEELFAYHDYVFENMDDLYEACDVIAHNIIIDILLNYCSQFMVKSIPGWTAADDEHNSYQLFLQANQEIGNTAEVITYNDTFKKPIERDQYYWMLPGSYVLTVYNENKQSIQEVPFDIAPREIKLLPLNREHLETVTGSIVIQNWKPTDAYQINITELERDAKYIWEVGNDRLADGGVRIWEIFKEGEFQKEGDPQAADNNNNEAEETLQPVWLYNPGRQELSVSKLPLMKYSITLTPVPENISKENIFGILRISSRAIANSDPLTIDLRFEKDQTRAIEDFGLQNTEIENEFKITRITFLIPDAFKMGTIEFQYSEGGREGGLYFNGYEKLVVESKYTEEEWNDFLEVNYSFRGGGKIGQPVFMKEDIEAKRDKIYIVNLTDYKEAGLSIDTGEKEKKSFGDWLKGIFGGNKEEN